MKRLAYFCLEGLRTQGPHQVWITLGMFQTHVLAENAATDSTLFKPDVQQTRIIAVYRDPGQAGLASNHAMSSRHVAATELESSYTVA